MPQINTPIRLGTDVTPGKKRDPFLEQQTKQIETALNQALGRQPVRTIVQTGVITVDDWWILVDASNGNVNVTLPLASAGQRAVGVKRIDGSGNTVTVLRSGLDLIDGAVSQTLAAQFDSITVVPDGGTGWFIF